MSAVLDEGKMLLEWEQKRAEFPRAFFEPDPWQVLWFAGAAKSRQAMLMAANQIGKTIAAAFEYACHLTGEYPDWWDDLPAEFQRAVERWPEKSDKPYLGPTEWPSGLSARGLFLDYAPLIWVMGVSGENMRDNLQKQLFGELVTSGKQNFFLPGGMVHPSEVGGSPIPATGTRALAKDIKVRSKHGGFATCSLKSYSQGQHALMGPKPDVVGIDEEPEDKEIYPQCVARTINSNKGRGGYVRLTFTPENGQTELVTQFTDSLGSEQYFQNATWADAAHITQAKEAAMLEAIPEYQRDMRSKGVPILGSGMVFPIAEERIKCDPFPLPEHYKVVAGIDVGIDHPTAGAWVAYDADTDVMYVYDTYRQADRNAPVHTSAFRQRSRRVPIPTIYPHDAEGREKGSGEQLIEVYRREGLPRPIQFENTDGTIHVEPGILEMLTRMQTGRFKVFSNLADWFQEFRLYHRKDGKIVKEADDIMSATRYAAIMVQRVGVYNRKRSEAERRPVQVAF